MPPGRRQAAPFAPVITNRTNQVQKLIIAIIDTTTEDIVGTLMLEHHIAPAIRLFSDVARMDNSIVAKHIDDMVLMQLGILDTDTWQIVANKRELITGKQWLAAQQPKDEGAPQ